MKLPPKSQARGSGVDKFRSQKRVSRLEQGVQELGVRGHGVRRQGLEMRNQWAGTRNSDLGKSQNPGAQSLKLDRGASTLLSGLLVTEGIFTHAQEWRGQFVLKCAN